MFSLDALSTGHTDVWVAHSSQFQNEGFNAVGSGVLLEAVAGGSL